MELMYQESYYCCENCQYYKGDYCRRHPPVVVMHEVEARYPDTNAMSMVFGWPTVYSTDYCGEFCIKHTYKKSRS